MEIAEWWARVARGAGLNAGPRFAEITLGSEFCNQHIVTAGEENTRGAGECEVGSGGDSGVASRSSVTAWAFLIQIVGLRECVACSASLGSPHRVAAEHVIAAECRDDLGWRIADQHVASLIADDVVFGTHAARLPAAIGAIEDPHQAGSAVGWLSHGACDRGRAVDQGTFVDYGCTSMRQQKAEYKRNQIEEAIFRVFGAREERRDELKFRIKRLLVTDRRLGRNVKPAKEEDQHYAFFGQEPPGSGYEVMFTAYQAFALLAAVILLEHGLPQASVVRVMRRVRRPFEAAHADIMRKDPRTLFDQQAILAQARPGMIATNNTDPVFLVFVRLTASSVDEQDGGSAVAVCRGPAQLQAFIKRHSVPGTGATFFEFVSLMHELAAHLSQTRPVKRGRAAG